MKLGISGNVVDMHRINNQLLPWLMFSMSLHREKGQRKFWLFTSQEERSFDYITWSVSLILLLLSPMP